jgi:prepilin signal peptidase PulO-like enzyme (type II secretory pathway)
MNTALADPLFSSAPFGAYMPWAMAFGFGLLAFTMAMVAGWFADLALHSRGRMMLFPLAFAVARGRGRKVKRTESLLHAAAATCFCALLPFLSGDPERDLLPLAIVIGMAVPAAVMDAKITIIPEEITWPLLFWGLMASPWTASMQDAAYGAAIGWVAMWMPMTLVGWTKGVDTRSGGDVAAAAAGGAIVGVSGLGVYLFLTAIIFMLHSAWSRSGQERWTPMGPALFASIPLAALCHEQVISMLSALRLPL